MNISVKQKVGELGKMSIVIHSNLKLGLICLNFCLRLPIGSEPSRIKGGL